ncbi:type IV pilin [Cellvibrio zantedeschiae]|uniref:Type IV pilin n=1 Tax=Cellvibrio zantedeschiae TaxID=1237077 RepID=A0ABQ3B6J7_9GAMM|nr:type IV pilin protein [Cellvibrio zantedeschiae]GGY80644.1 type IV pilin [Cellvibrio zantedeschiae]
MIKMKTPRGFTLVELMAVIAIVAVLGAVAYPSYLQSVRKSNRAEAKSELSDAIQRFQRCYTVFGTFKPASGCPIYEDLKNGGAYVSHGKGFYQIKLDTVTAISDTTVKLVATAIKAPQTSDTASCRTLTLNQVGLKTPTDCW